MDRQGLQVLDGPRTWRSYAVVRDANRETAGAPDARTAAGPLSPAERELMRWTYALDEAGLGVAIASGDGRVIEAVDPAFARMHGYTTEALAGSPLLDVFAPEVRPAVAELVRVTPDQGRQDFDSEHIRKDGTSFPVAIQMTAVRDAVGRVTYRAIQAVDLTDRKRQEEALRDSTLSRDVLDRLLEGCQVISFDWRYLYVNELLVAQSRRRREELVGRTMMECYPGIEQTPMFAQLQRAMRERVVAQMENDFAYPDGARVVYDLRFVPIPQGVCILSLDITERRHRLAAIVNDSDDAIIGRTLDGVVTSWNRSAERMFGYAADEMIGRGIGALFPEHLKDAEAAIAARLVEGERIDHFETQRQTKDGRLLDVSVTLSPVRDTAGRLVGVSKIARDITEIKRTRRELERAKEAAEVANRELEAFSYSVAHDLRAPLRTIDGFSQALLDDCGDRLDADGQRHLRYVREAAQLMAHLIDDVLTLSRVTRSDLRREAVDLSALARAAVARLEQAGPRRDLAVVIAGGVAADGDPRLLGLVLDNLLSNAWKFTAKRAGGARIEFGADTVDGEARYFVRDNGAGFDMTYVDKLFGAFQRLHAAHDFEGTGVGLATVQRVVHRHGGRVWAEGEVGVGATFTFTLGKRESFE